MKKRFNLLLIVIACLIIQLMPIHAETLTCNYVKLTGNVGDLLVVEFFDGKTVYTDWETDSAYIQNVGNKAKVKSGGNGVISFKVNSNKVDIPFNFTGTDTVIGNNTQKPVETPTPTQTPVSTPTPTQVTTPVTKPTATQTPVDTTTQQPVEQEQSQESKPETSKALSLNVWTTDSDKPNLTFSLDKTTVLECVNGELDLSQLTTVQDLYLVKTRTSATYYYKIGEVENYDNKLILTTSNADDLDMNKITNTLIINGSESELK